MVLDIMLHLPEELQNCVVDIFEMPGGDRTIDVIVFKKPEHFLVLSKFRDTTGHFLRTMHVNPALTEAGRFAILNADDDEVVEHSLEAVFERGRGMGWF